MTAQDATTQLMQKIRAAWGEAIVLACASSSVPPSFIAALIANESGGNAGAHRFEKGVLAALWEVLLGRAPAYGSVKRDDLLCFLCPSPLPLPGNSITVATVTVGGAPQLPDSMQRLDSLATSHGLTQVMGYEVILFHLDGIQRLQDPASELPITLNMLADFAHRFGLDLSASSPTAAGELFDCWNSGRPHAPTADPQYIPNGLARMEIYQNLTASVAG